MVVRRITSDHHTVATNGVEIFIESPRAGPKGGLE